MLSPSLPPDGGFGIPLLHEVVFSFGGSELPVPEEVVVCLIVPVLIAAGFVSDLTSGGMSLKTVGNSVMPAGRSDGLKCFIKLSFGLSGYSLS